MSALSGALGALLKLVFEMINNYGLAIIIFTILVKLALYPLTRAQTKSMKEMQHVQPMIKQLQEKYKDNQQLMQQKVMEVYKEHKINPAAGCLPILIQMPILIGLFNVLREPVKYVFKSQAAYDAINTSFMWITDLAKPDVVLLGGFEMPWILPILAALTTYFASAMMNAKTPKTDKKDPTQMTQMMMLYMLPLMILWWGKTFPAGLTLYWVVSNVFQIAQQYIIMRPEKS